MKHSKAKSLEIIFVLLAITAYTGVLVRLFITRSQGLIEINDNNIFGQALFALTYLAAGVYFYSKPNALFLSLIKMPAVWLLVFWAFLSFTWSYSPDITLRRSIALIGTTLFATYLATRFSLAQNFKFLGISFSLVLLACYIFAFLSPAEPAWTGVFFTKNELTRTSLLASFVSVYLLITTREKFWGVSILAALILIYKSSSATGIILSAISLGIILLFFVLNNTRNDKKINIIILSALLTVFVSVIILLNLEEVLAFFQKDLTLTGRVPLWNMVWLAIQQNPVLGYGYGGFWNGWDGPSANIWAVLYWLPPHAHNGFLDIALDLGLIGVFIYMVVYISLVYRISKNNQRSKNFNLFMFLFVFFLLIYNLFENIALNRNSIIWLMIVMFFVQSSISPKGPNNHGTIEK